MPRSDTHGYEFGGPLGAAAISFGLPVLCYAFTFICTDLNGCPASFILRRETFSLSKVGEDVGWPGFSNLFNAKAFAAVLGYYILSILLYALLPATLVEGTELKSGGRLKYRLNAFYSALFTVAIVIAGASAQGADFPFFTFVSDNYLQILSSNIVISYILATFVYVRSFGVKKGNKEKRELAEGGITGNILYDWFIGRELNPCVTFPVIGDLDIKSFMEIRPGLLGWFLLNLVNIARQYRVHGIVTNSIVMVSIFQGFYVLDALFMEPAILTTIDITTDGFGFMLAFGDLVWVPFIYSLQTRYLAMHPVHLTYAEVAAITTIAASGFYIFRASNNEKNRFRTNPKDPKVAHLKYMSTKTGSKLLISGWWGTCRHVNYFGDWLMSWAFCLPTGVAGFAVRNEEIIPSEGRGWAIPITYFYLVYFAVLLIHRERRDEQKCRRKYGADWEEYCKKVPWRIVYGVY